MSELQKLIESAYEMAKAGHWEKLLAEWEDSPVLINRCSRYTKLRSSWTFLHQAAYFGNEQACRALISRGACVAALTHDALSPARIAEQRGHSDLAALLQNASIADSLWSTPTDPDVCPSSNRWEEARRAISALELFVSYGGGLVRIPKQTPYFVDALNRVLIGWHGSFNPPCDMDAESMLSD